MKVLFVCSGNRGVSPIVQAQGDSLVRSGLVIQYYPLSGRGILGYLRNIPRLRRHILQNKPDIVHAHYSLSALIAVAASGKTPVVASYMGNDAVGDYGKNGKFKLTSLPILIVSILIQPYLSFAISKSANTDMILKFVKHQIIPNGVDFDIFRPMAAELKTTRKVLFLGNTRDVNKNFSLLLSAVKYLRDIDIKVEAPYPFQHDELPILFAGADLLCLCSIVEGSPNVVKEAMACNCPVVATNVGDVKWLFGDLEGHYLCKHDPADVAKQIKAALEFGRRTTGRDRLLELKLDSESVAKKIIAIYIKSLGR